MSHNARLVRKKRAVAEQETAQKLTPSGTQAPEQGVSAHGDGLALPEQAPATDSHTQRALNYGHDFSKIRIHPDSPLPGTEDTGNNQMAPPGYVLNPLTQVSSPQNADNAPPPALPWLTRPSPAAPLGQASCGVRIPLIRSWETPLAQQAKSSIRKPPKNSLHWVRRLLTGVFLHSAMF